MRIRKGRHYNDSLDKTAIPSGLGFQLSDLTVNGHFMDYSHFLVNSFNSTGLRSNLTLQLPSIWISKDHTIRKKTLPLFCILYLNVVYCYILTHSS